MDESDDLLLLDPLDRWLVVQVWRLLLWRQSIRRVPTPLRLAVLNFLVTTVLELVFPFTRAKSMTVPLLWAASFSLTTTICLLLPLKQRPLIRVRK